MSEEQQKQIDDLKDIILIMQQEIEQLKKQIQEKHSYKIIDKLPIDDNKDLSIIFTQYKKSILIKNKYSDKNTTMKCKELLKEMGAKWFKTGDIQGWLFVGEFKEGKTLQENSKFIIEKLQDNNFNLDIEY